MHSERHSSRTIMCPHLKGGHAGALCGLAKELIRNIENVDIKFCMSRHFETCHVYFNSLRQESIHRASLRAR